MSSHILEVRKFLDKKLLCDIQIATTQYEIFDKIIETDKWLRFEDWQQLYERLEKILLIHSSPNLGKLYAQNFQISNNIEVYVEKSPLESAHWEICSVPENELLPLVLTIKVSKIDVNALTKKITKLEKLKRGCQNCSCKDKVRIRVKKDLCREYDPVQASGGGKNDAPPYKPYKPSIKTESLTDITEKRQEKEEYSPKPVGNTTDKFNFEGNVEGSLDCYTPSTEESPDQNVPPYIPSEIKSTSNIKEEVLEISSESDMLSPKLKEGPNLIPLRTTRKRQHPDQNMVRENLEHALEENRETRSKRKKGGDSGDTEKCRFSQDLFGSDDSDQEADIKLKGSDPHETRSKDGKRDKIKDRDKIAKPSKLKSEQMGKSDESSSKRHYKDTVKSEDIGTKEAAKDDKKHPSSRENGKQSKKKLKSSKSSESQTTNVTPPKPKLTEEEKQRNRDTHEKEMKMLKNFKEGIRALNKSPPVVDIIKLDHLKPEDLVATFDEFKPILDSHFMEHKKRKTHVVKAMKDMNHLLTMSVIEDNKIFPLLNHLKENYETDADINVPSYTDLFMNLMLPEWILAIFMKEHKLSRAEAIERIKTQNQLDTSNSSFS